MENVLFLSWSDARVHQISALLKSNTHNLNLKYTLMVVFCRNDLLFYSNLPQSVEYFAILDHQDRQKSMKVEHGKNKSKSTDTPLSAHAWHNIEYSKPYITFFLKKVSEAIPSF